MRSATVWREMMRWLLQLKRFSASQNLQRYFAKNTVISTRRPAAAEEVSKNKTP
jgi:hypothetical protein